jgi:large subunit ribosomal protein L15
MVQLPNYFVTINNLRDVPGATKARKRVGRGDGGDRGKTSGKGHKGQKARSGTPGPLFDGGTRHLRKFPKVHLQPK